MQENPKILGMDGKPINGVQKVPRKQIRERKRFQAVLLDLVNQYITFCNENEDKSIQGTKFIALNRKWIEYALKWNANTKNTLVLRITDFTNFIEDYEKKQEKEK